MLQLRTKYFLFVLLCIGLLMGPMVQSRAEDAPKQGASSAETTQTKHQIPAALIAKWKTEAEAGNATAQFLLGNAYYNGNGVPQDYNEAISWWQKSADQGNASAKKALEQLVPK